MGKQMNTYSAGNSKQPNTFAFNDRVADVETIAREGLRKRAIAMLEPPASMFGVKGMRKLVRELPRWPEELDPKQLDISLRHLVEFTGAPPIPPLRLMGGVGEMEMDVPDDHTAGRDIFAGLLRQLSEEYEMPVWAEAAALFEQSGQTLVVLTDTVVDHILGQRDALESASELLTEIADMEELAFRMIRDV